MSDLPVSASYQQAGEIASAVRNSACAAIHLETVSHGGTAAMDPWHGGIRAIVLAVPGGPPWFIDLKEWGGIPAELAQAIGSSEIVAHGARNVLLWLGVKSGIRPKSVFCTQTAAWLLAAGIPEPLDLASVLARHLRLPAEGEHAQSDWGGLFLTEGQIDSAFRQVSRLHELRKALRRAIGSADLQAVCELEMNLLPVVAAMEEAGIAIDIPLLERQREEADLAMQEAARKLSALLKTPALNPSSPSQLVKALARAGIAVEDTGEASLKAVDDGLVVPAILDFRSKEKVSQQAAGLMAAVQADGRIHARFEPAGTDTGRFSCHSPNLQNIGRGSIRSVFMAPPGRALVVADYSQIELRVAAAIAGEEKMIAAYERGEDLHVLTAAAILDKPAAEVDKEDRQIAKSANFGLLYGQGAKGLVSFARQSYGVTLSVPQALAIRTRFFSAYPAIAQWHADCSKSAGARVGEARTALGRRRRISPGADRWQRFTALINAPVQGGAADGLKQAMVDLPHALPSGARLVSTIHDELIIECDEIQAPEVSAHVQEIMTAAMQKLFPSVPIRVDVTAGQNWGA